MPRLPDQKGNLPVFCWGWLIAANLIHSKTVKKIVDSTIPYPQNLWDLWEIGAGYNGFYNHMDKVEKGELI